MNKIRGCNHLNGFLFLLLVSNPAVANDELLGHWRITSPIFNTTLLPVPLPMTYDVTIEKDDNGYRGWAYNGPLEVRVENEKIAITIDWVASSDIPYKTILVGTLNSKGELTGTVDHGGAVSFNKKESADGVFTGIRIDAPNSEKINLMQDLSPDPVDISGLWMPTFSRMGFNKYMYDLTPKGKRVYENFSDFDAPHIRCASYGLVTTFYYSIFLYDVEIFQSDEQITLLYGADTIRRIYLDDREYPEDKEAATYMGFSKGEWKGSTLVVRSTHLLPNFLRAGHGHPISRNAEVVEHFSLDDEGYLKVEMWVVDPENYNRPPYFVIHWDKNFVPEVITEHGCDPKSFFRQLHMESELDDYFDRARYHR